MIESLHDICHKIILLINKIFTYVVLLPIHFRATLINIQSFIYMLDNYGIRGKSLKCLKIILLLGHRKANTT